MMTRRILEHRESHERPPTRIDYPGPEKVFIASNEVQHSALRNWSGRVVWCHEQRNVIPPLRTVYGKGFCNIWHPEDLRWPPSIKVVPPVVEVLIDSATRGVRWRWVTEASEDCVRRMKTRGGRMWPIVVPRKQADQFRSPDRVH
jgi:hypothetical protein